MVFEAKGIIPAMVTPLRDDEDLDREGLRKVVRFLLEAGVHGVFAVGSQGEFWALSKEEKRVVWEVVVDEVNGRVPVYAGTGAESTREALELTRIAKDVGCDAASIITPYYISPGGGELFEHYKTIAGSVDLPIILYNNPPRTKVSIDPDIVPRLVEECSNIVGIKDSSGDLSITMDYIRRGEGKLSVLAGRDTLIYSTLMCGGKGAIAACANVVPRLVVEIYESFVNKDYGKALDAQYKLAPLRNSFNLGTFPAVIKEAMNMIGLPTGPCRRPVMPMKPENREKLRSILQSYKLLP